jgi:endonuclease/exonuclease/phosphatase family metal-dependent hydrolase
MRTLYFLLLICKISLGCHAPSMRAASEPQFLSVLTWNIWHGGREDGTEIGPQRVVEVIRESGADLVAMQETYGSGEIISQALGFHFRPRGTNVSIHSRYPILEDVSVFEEFKCVGAVVELPSGRKLAFYGLWLPYNAEIWEEGTRAGKSVAELQAACASSASDLAQILAQIDQRLKAAGYAHIPIILAGDFNSMSHLDYIESAIPQYGAAIDWRTSHVITDAGYTDSYRQIHPTVNRQADRTWTPRFPKQQQDRIDFIYYKSDQIHAIEADVLDHHPQGFPSDHAALRTRFILSAELASIR